jgi:hypothetical protein
MQNIVMENLIKRRERRGNKFTIKRSCTRIYQPLKIYKNINKPKYQLVRSYIKFKINLQAEHTEQDSERAHYYKKHGSDNNQKINIK